MKNVVLHVPNLKELWYREKCMTDPDTMSYNAGYDLSFEGYHYDTGCIEFPKSKHEEWLNNKNANPNFFFAYIEDVDTKEWVGYVNFKKNEKTKHATMGIVMESIHRGKGYMRPAMIELVKHAAESGVEVLTDTVPESREKALKLFYDLGFEKTGQYVGTKFGKDEVIAEIEYIVNQRNK